MWGKIYTPQGVPISGAEVVAKIAGVETEYDDKLMSKEDVTTTSDENGFWSIKILYGLRINIFISEINDEKTFIVPEQPSINFKEISD